MSLTRILRPLSVYLRQRPTIPALASHRCTTYPSHHLSTTANDTSQKMDTVLLLTVQKDKVQESVLRAISAENASRSERRHMRKRGLVESFRRGESDTGSPEVQIALLTDRIRDLTEHVQQHKKDKASRRSLVLMVNQRRRVMKYLLRESTARYVDVVKRLGLRPSSVFSKDVGKGAKKMPTPKLH